MSEPESTSTTPATVTDNNTVLPDPIVSNILFWERKIAELMQQYPDIERAALQIARQVLARAGLFDLDPYQVHWHWFDSANSSSRTYTGWEHYGAPKQSMTLVELVMRRFDLDQQRNSDLLAQMGGFYRVDQSAHAFNEHNEIRLDPRQVHAYFWRIDFAAYYASKVRGFWINNHALYCMVSKLSMLCNATLNCQKGTLRIEDFIEVYAAVVNDSSTPFKPEKLMGDVAMSSSTKVYSFDIEGIVSHTMLRFRTVAGREIVYCAMQDPAFVAFADTEQIYEWVQSYLTTEQGRKRFGEQFVRPEHDKHGQWNTLQGHLRDIANTPWKQRKTRLNAEEKTLDGYAFTFLTDCLKTDMESDASYLLISNNQLSKGLWLGYLEASFKLYSIFSMMGWPIAALSIAAGLGAVGLYADKAINAVNERERSDAIRSAVLQALNVFLTLPLLGDLSAIGEYEEAGMQLELETDGESVWGGVVEDTGDTYSGGSSSGDDFDPLYLGSDEDRSSTSTSTSTSSDSPSPSHGSVANRLLEWRPAVVRGRDLQVQTRGPMAGLYVRQGNQIYAQVHNVLYRVRYRVALKQWAVVDPLNPYATEECIPLTLDAKGVWHSGERIAAASVAEAQRVTAWDVLRTDLASDVHVPPLATQIRVTVPLDGVEKILDRYMVRIPSRGSLLALYDADEKTWRLNHLGNTDYLWLSAEGDWRSGDRLQWQAAAKDAPAARATKSIVLPPLPILPAGASAIPRVVHYIWVGHELPSQALLDNVVGNAAAMQGWRTVLHVDLESETLLTQLKGIFADKPGVAITPLADQDFFQTLLTGDSGPQYRACRNGQARNYAAASDVLRYPLIDAHGGLYMDVDNTFTSVHADLQLNAGPEDVLLDDAMVLADVPYSGYNGHVFASHARNPVLKAVTRAMQARFKARPDFYAKPRPILRKGASTSETRTFWRYVKDTFEMTGPQLLDDVLRETRPDYYDLLLRADLKQSLGISSQAYERQLTACVEHYFPFAGRVEVEVGNLHSWTSTR